MSVSNDVVNVQSAVGRYQLALPAGDHIAGRITATGQPYEPRLLAAVLSLTRPGDHVVDVGANIGNHTTFWAKAGRRVTAFEPNPETRSYLERNIELNQLGKLVTVHGTALGRAKLRGALNAFSVGNLGAVAVEESADGDVDIRPLDEFALDDVALVKIDVEGHEAEVLAGAVETLRRCRPYVVAEAFAGHDAATQILRDLGYVRIPISLAGTDSYLYAPGGHRLRLLTSGALWKAGARQGFRAVAVPVYRALPGGLRRSLRSH